MAARSRRSSTQRLNRGRRTGAATHVTAREIVLSSSDAERFFGRGIIGILRQGIPWRLYFAYYRPSFDPWNHDNSRFVAVWKKCYPGFDLA